ncbi:hypothetical protein TNCV_4496611 [Trichonephila clavipes]|nr:hypothetical protein TNCV_4496611 [Trichonephila clavipes]
MVFTRNLCADSTSSDFNCPFTLDPDLQLLMNLLHRAITRISLVKFENLLMIGSNGFDLTTKGIEFNPLTGHLPPEKLFRKRLTLILRFPSKMQQTFLLSPFRTWVVERGKFYDPVRSL